MSIRPHTEEERLLSGLHEALILVALDERDELILRFLAGYGPDIATTVASLLQRQALAHAARTEPTHIRSSRDGDPALAEGLPSHMRLGVTAGPPRTPWWECTRCAMTYRGSTVERIRAEADAHVRTVHGGAR